MLLEHPMIITTFLTRAKNKTFSLKGKGVEIVCSTVYKQVCENKRILWALDTNSNHSIAIVANEFLS